MSNDQSPENPISKSQLKKEMLALQKLGETLTKLAASELAKIPLPPALEEAIHFSHTLKTHESKRRHLQYIGKMMREIDITPIEIALKKLQTLHLNKTAEFHLVEEWRDRLIAQGDIALQELLSLYPDLERQKLRQLIRKAQGDLKAEKNSGATTELFRYLKSHLAD